MSDVNSRRQLQIIIVVASMLLSGCSTSIWVEADFPQPLVNQLPVSMGLILDDDLLDYVHYEELPRQASYTIQIGEANELMLVQLFESMFTDLTEYNEFPLIEPDSVEIDGVLWPELERFEFDVPVGQRDEFVEVWIQYIVKLYETDGQLVTEWPVSGYGKAEMIDRDDALNSAIVVAMREVGATISTKFTDQPELQDWLQERGNEASL
ncbi:MAG: hypothetical protein P8M36_00915 [Gammaproteobacteria bacterium]|nr:hypothetical protein [Gammaproteobacteria bacterium]